MTFRVLVLIFAFAAAAGAVEWPTYAGGPRRLFFNPAETQITPANVHALRVKWRFRAGAAVTASPSVAIVDLPGEGPTQVVFAPSWDHTLYALRLRDGSEVWRFAVPDYPGGSYPDVASVDVSVVGGVQRAYFASEQTLYAVDPRTGAELWRFHAGTGCADPPGLCGFNGERNEIESSPLVADGMVFFGMDTNDRPGGKGGFYAVDAADGHMVWFFDLESGMTCRPDADDFISRYDGYHSLAELGLPADFFDHPGCDHPRTPNGCSLVWSSAAYDAARHLVFTVSGNCDTDDDPASLRPPPPMPPYDEAIFALHTDGTPAWRWRPREVDNLDFDFGAVPNLFTIDVDGTPRDVVGVGGKDGTYYVIDREGTNVRNGIRWDAADPSALPYWRRQVVPGGSQGGIIATASVDEAARRITFSTAPGDSVFSPQRPTVHVLDMTTGAILAQNVAETTADASFAPTSGIPNLAFVGGAASGVLRVYDPSTATRVTSVPVSFVLVSGATVVDGHVLVGGGVGEQSDNPNSTADIVSRLPQDVTALCVSGTPACDADQDGYDFPDDCDDQNPRAHPGGREIGGNADDEDCDGFLAGPRDACLAQGSAPQDRRDLDAVRALMEIACPCGGSGRPGDHRRCARRVIRDAVRRGELRQACVALLRRTTCARPRTVLCCERRDAHQGQCRVRKSGRCVSTRGIARTVLPGATNCADTDCALVPPTTTTTAPTSTTTTTTTSTSTTTLPASWAAIHAAVIGPVCGSCHGAAGAGGLAGLDGCTTGYAALVGIPSVRLPAMNLVQPGAPGSSFLVHKLAGTQGTLDAQCVGGSCGGSMPANRPTLPTAEQDAIRGWILGGATNDCP